ncbi:MAG: FAD-binding oxidoreductase [Patulibacter minatonensis]
MITADLDPDTSRWRPARVLDRWDETPRIATLRIGADRWPGHVAGQRVDVRLTAQDGYQANRAYSIASAPSSGVLDLAVERLDDGEVSPWLVDIARAGDELEVRGPVGGWFTWRPTDPGPLLMLAGGSGLVPLMAMAREAVAAATGTDVRLLVSTRTAAELPFAEELAMLDAAGSLRLLHTVTRGAPDGWDGWRGRMGSALAAELLDDLPSAPPAIFICGGSGFVDHASHLLMAEGVDARAIRTERFGPSS